MTSNKIILTADEIPANSAFTLEEWQGIVDDMQKMDTEDLEVLQSIFQASK